MNSTMQTETPETLELSVVMPCLDESETLATCIEKARRELEDEGIRGEIIIADNGSTDGSQEVARERGARVVSVETRGYGSALMGGIREARGEYVIMGDADDSYDFSNLLPFVTKLREGYDLVMGNRLKGGIKPGAMPPLHRFLGNPVLSWIGRVLFHSPVGDFHCGLRGFRRTAILGLDLRTTGMEFASEMVVKATLNRLRITEVPTTLSPDGRSRPPHLRSWRDGWRHLRFMLLYSPNWLFLYPGGMLMLLGLALSLWLLPGERELCGVELNVHTLLYGAMAIVIGYQAVIFALFSKTFAVMENLLPESPGLNRLLNLAPLETGLGIGAVLLLIGAGGTVYAFTSWGLKSFGPLDPSHSLRIVIPSVTLFMLGLQTILASFFLSILGLKRD